MAKDMDKPAGSSAAQMLFRYRLEDAAIAECPFQGQFRSDEWVIYHGTSNHAERVIEREGFCWKPDYYDLAAVKHVTDVFDQLYWAGTVHDGYPVLATFTMSDFARGNGQANKAVYFGETARRCLLYASPYYAGGETAMALRHAFTDLQRYLVDRKFRREQLIQSYKSTRRFFHGPVPRECEPTNLEDVSFENLRHLWAFYRKTFDFKKGCPVDFSEGWLQERLDELQPIREKAEACAAFFTHGLIYAVKVETEDLGLLTYGSGGIACATLVPSARIVAKCIIERNVFNQLNHLEVRLKESKERMKLITSPGSLYAHVREAPAKAEA